jgi:hypothetical protein
MEKRRGLILYWFTFRAVVPSRETQTKMQRIHRKRLIAAGGRFIVTSIFDD